MRRFTALALTAALAAAPTLAAAATVVPPGTLTGTQTWTAAGSPWTLSGDVTVVSGATLTIEAGAVVQVASGDTLGSGEVLTQTELRVEGTLIAQGTAANRVTMEGSGWYGVVVLAAGTANLTEVDVSGAVRGLYVKGSTATTVTGGRFHGCSYGVYVEGGTAQLAGAELSQNSSRGLYVTTGGGGRVTGARIHGNSSYGVELRDSSFEVSDSLLYDNGSRGVYVYDYDGTSHTYTLTGNTIVANGAYGVYLYEATSGVASVVVRDNIITGHTTYGLYETGGASVSASYNVVWQNGTDYYGVTGSSSPQENPLFVDLTGRDLRITSNSPARLHASDGGDIGALAYDGAPTGFLAGHLYENTTLPAAGSPHAVTGDLTVEPGITLTLEPGATLTFADTDLMYGNESSSLVELRILGNLVASGTAAQGILLEAAGTGRWRGPHLYAGSTSALDYVTVRGATYGVYSEAATGTTVQRSTLEENQYGAYVRAGGISISESVVRNNTSYGVYVTDASPTIADSLIYDNASRGVYVSDSDSTSATVTLTGNTLVDNGTYGIYLYEATSGVLTAVIRDNIVTGHTSYGIYESGGASVSATYNLVWSNGTDYYAVTAGSGSMSENPLFVDLTNRDLRITSNSPARLHASDGGDIGALSYDGTPTGFLAGHLYASTTLTAAGSPHLVLGDLVVESGVTLAIAPGATVRFAADTDLMRGGEDVNRTELRVFGTLLADGTASSGVVLESDASTPGLGDWYGVYLYPSATTSFIDQATIRHAVYGVRSDAGVGSAIQRSTLERNSSYGVYVSRGSLTVDECIIRENNSRGLYVADADATITDNLIYDNNGRGVYLYDSDSTSATVTLAGNTIVANGAYGVYIGEGTSGVLSVVLRDNIVHGHTSYGLYQTGGASVIATYNLAWQNGTDYYGVSAGSGSMSENPLFVDFTNRDLRITSNSPARMHASDGGDMGALAWDGALTVGLQGHLYENTTWADNGSFHVVLGDITVEPGVTLTIAAGAEVHLPVDADSMGGNLNAGRTELRVDGRLVVAGTAVDPVLFTPDTTTPGRGDWYGIHLLPGSTSSSISHAIIEYAQYGILSEAGAGTTVRGGEVRESASNGVQITDGAALFDGVNVHHNGSSGVYVSDAGPDLHNLVVWGNASYGISVSDSDATSETVDILHCTVAGNSGYGVRLYEGTSGVLAVNLRNNIVTANNGTYGVYESGGATVSATYNNVWGQATNYYGVTAGTGSISANPMLVDAATGNFHLTQSSPCIDAADPSSAITSDAEGAVRPLDGTQSGTAVADIGAYEYNPAANKWPIADAGPDRIVESGVQVTFSGAGSYDPDGTIASYHWDFGDGSTAAGIAPTHTFTGGTDRVVVLTVTDDQGATDTDSLNVEVNLPPVAEAGTEKWEDAGIAVSFTGNASTDPDGTVVAWHWDFGDGANATGVSVSHQYQNGGDYTVTLTVTDDDGATGTDTTTAHILGGADVTAPGIGHTPVAGGQPEGQAVTIVANVTDTSGVGSVNLHYRTTGAATFTAVAMAAGTGSTFSAAIPAATVRLPSVEYYVEATDTASTPNTGTSPSGAPGAFHRFTVADQTAPVLSHTPIAAGQTAGSGVQVLATVTDASGVASVTLFYRTQGQSAYATTAMASSGGDAWSGAIPAAYVTVPGVEYYLVATDTASAPNSATHPAGAPASVHAFTVVDPTAPVIAHTPVADGQTESVAVTVTATITDQVGVASATLRYRRRGEATFASTAFTGSGDTWTAQLPAAAVLPPAVEYWIEAEDAAANSATSPSTAPGTWHAFTVTGTDRDPPVIAHTPVADGQVEAATVQVGATVTDASGLASVTLSYRTEGSTTWATAAMSAGGGSYYVADIPAAAVQQPGVEYWIEAVDAADTPHTAVEPSGAPTSIHGFTVVSSDTSPPSIAHTPVSNGQPEGQAVGILVTVTDTSGVGGATLYYRATGASAFASVAMADGGNGDWSAEIPAAVVARPGVDYYVEASDTAGNIATEPPNAPSSFHGFTVEREFTLEPGDLVITEIMRDPSGAEATAEWFEIHNASGAAIDLDGLLFADDGTDDFVVSGAVIVPAGGYRVLGKSAELAVNGGVPVDYVYSGLYLGNGADELVILAGTLEIDRVAWDDATFPDMEGASMSLDPGAIHHVENDDGSNWCTASSALSGGDLGTPGAPNDSCAPPADLDPPVIVHTAVTDGQPAGLPVEVRAVITDASGVAFASLWFRVAGAGDFTEVAMIRGTADDWQAQIPASEVTVAGVEYWIEAIDAAADANAARTPADAPTSVHAFAVTEDDTSGPAITHDPLVGPVSEGVSLTVTAVVTDASGVAEVVLGYGPQGGPFTEITMVETAADGFAADIPAEAVVAPAVAYYLHAVDGSSLANTSVLPESGEIVVPVEIEDLDGPVLVHTPVADGQPAGGAVTLTAQVTDASGVSEVRVHFRSAGVSGFLSASLVSTGDDVFTGEIPGAMVGEPAVEYYLEAVDASDDQNVTREPAAAPAEVHTFTVEAGAGDVEGPTLVHTPVADGVPVGVAVRIEAEITDPSGVAGATVLYRVVGEGQLTELPMTADGDLWSAEIPAEDVRIEGVQYYLRALDASEAANPATSPAAAPDTLHVFMPGDEPVGTESGCGCGVGSGASGALWSLLALGLLAFRRRARRAP